MVTRWVLTGLLVAAGFVAGVVVTGRMQAVQESAAQSDTAHETPTVTGASAPGTSAAPAPQALPAAGAPDFTQIAERTVSSVVNISSLQVVRAPRSPFAADPFFRQFLGEDELFGERRGQSAGSGVIISPDGYILTNNHVVGEHMREVTVILSDKRERPARLIGIDPMTDLALLKIEGRNLPTIPWGDSSQLKVAEWVLAIGNPYQLGQTVTLGIVSGVNRTYSNISSVVDYIQTDAAINPGNSGGALISRRGELVGINTWIYSESGGYQGIGFAVPSNLARNITAELVKFGEVRRGTIGFLNVTEVTPALAREYGLGDTRGLLVWSTRQSAPVYQAGVRPGDIITSINGQKLESVAQFQRILIEAPIGSVVSLGLLRDGKPLEVRVPVTRQPSTRRNAA